MNSFIRPWWHTAQSVNCHFLCIFTLYINTQDNHLFSFFQVAHAQSDLATFYQNGETKKLGERWISIRFDMKV